MKVVPALPRRRDAAEDARNAQFAEFKSPKAQNRCAKAHLSTRALTFARVSREARANGFCRPHVQLTDVSSPWREWRVERKVSDFLILLEHGYQKRRAAFEPARSNMLRQHVHRQAAANRRPSTRGPAVEGVEKTDLLTPSTWRVRPHLLTRATANSRNALE